MIIDVEMTNWRAFDHQVFSFEPGLNFIMGANGQGKTSILEAISYGLTGEPSVVKNRDQLLRNPSEPADVKVTFTVDEDHYRVERTQQPGRAGPAALYDLQNNKKIANSHKKVTEKIEEIIGVSADFLRRIVYMAEGDVFQFLDNPPGEAMNQQIQMVLGITQLDQFQKAIKDAQSDLRKTSKGLDLLQNRIREVGLAGKEIKNSIEVIQNQSIKIKEQILNIRDKLSRREEQKSSILKLDNYLQNQLGALEKSEKYWEELQNIPLVPYYEQLQSNVVDQQDGISEKEKSLAMMMGNRESFKQILEIIDTTSTEAEEVLCPVCSKPMTQSERAKVIEETQENIDALSQKIKDVEKEIKGDREDLQRLQYFVNGLQEIRNHIVHTQIPDIQPNMSLPEVRGVIEKSRQDPQKQEWEEELSNLSKQQDEVEKEYAEYVSIQNQLKTEGFDQIEDVQNSLVKIESRQLVLKAASQSAEETLADMRDIGLQDIYKQITSVWNHFIGKGEWELKFDTDGVPLLSEETEREFSFGQFSGGEKTALLVMIHTIIAHHFSNCQFLLIDEPLEHLDPVNRRSIMRFFIGARSTELCSQALITTYEESLVRKYIDEEHVNIIYL